MSYDELKYWNSRPCPNSIDGHGLDDTVRKFFVDRLPVRGGRILDFGAGIGRMFPFFQGSDEVVAVEISRIYISRLLSEAVNYNFQFSVVLSNNLSIPPFLKGFDVAVASMVFLHQKPEKIRDIMCGLACTANEVLVSTWRREKEVENSNISEHCFNHDYKELCNELGLKIIDWDLDKERLLFSYALS